MIVLSSKSSVSSVSQLTCSNTKLFRVDSKNAYPSIGSSILNSADKVLLESANEPKTDSKQPQVHARTHNCKQDVAAPFPTTKTPWPVEVAIQVPKHYLDYEYIHVPDTVTRKFLITSQTTLSDLYQFILNCVVKESYNNAVFARPENVRFFSTKSPFHRDHFQSDQKKILDKFDTEHLKNWREIVYNNIKDLNTYKVDMNIKNEYKLDLVRLLRDQQRMHTQSVSNLFDTDACSIAATHGSLESESKDASEDRIWYKYDKFAQLNAQFQTILCKNDRHYAKLWKRHQLKKQSDKQLENSLYQLLGKYVKECQMDQDFFERKKKELQEKVEKKMVHPRHSQMGSPLIKSEMLSIIMWSDLHIYQSLSSFYLADAKDKKSYAKEYVVFDYCLFWAVTKLSSFNSFSTGTQDNRQADDQKSKVVLFSGAHNVSFDKETASKKLIQFAKFTSFTTRLDVATNFCQKAAVSSQEQSNGVVLALENLFKGVVCADISWISRFGGELEILVRRHCAVQYLETIQTDEYQVVKLSGVSQKTRRRNCKSDQNRISTR